MRKQEIDYLKGPLILNLEDRTLDLGNWYIKRNLRTYSLIWTWFLGCRCMKPSSCNASNATGFESWKLCNAHEILSYFCDFDLIFFVFFVFVENTDWLSLSERHDNSWDFILSFCISLRGLPQSVCFVWFSHLTILEWRQWSRLTFKHSTEILILGFSRFFLKTSIILHSKKT